MWTLRIAGKLKMAGNVKDFIEFLGAEESNQLKSCLHLREEVLLIGGLDILFRTIVDETYTDKEEHKIAVILFLNVHREFYLSMVNFVRLHTNKAFCNLRSAIDSALTAYYLLKNKDNQEVYLFDRNEINKESRAKKEWSKAFRNIKATIKNNIEDYAMAEELVKAHEFCSRFAHADAFDILTRCFENPEMGYLRAMFFDYEKIEEQKEKLINILSWFLEIINLFWNIIFKEIARKEVTQNITNRIIACQNKVKELRIKLCSANQQMKNYCEMQ